MCVEVVGLCIWMVYSLEVVGLCIWVLCVLVCVFVCVVGVWVGGSVADTKLALDRCSIYILVPFPGTSTSCKSYLCVYWVLDIGYWVYWEGALLRGFGCAKTCF